MKKIDIATWHRKEHFEFFRRADLPFYNVNLNLDITGLREFAKRHSVSLNTVLIYITVKSMNSVENFRYRLHNDTVILHDQLNPSFAHIKGNDDLFSMITVDYCEDLIEFSKRTKDAIDSSSTYFDLAKLGGRDDLIFISPLPWIPFTGVDHTLSLKKDDGIPRISWGKFFEQKRSMQLPFNVQVNHMFVDGIHVGKFIEKLNETIAATMN
jgi:chloramphenicol O-acetyltransferase type A